jgi:hypothetical protein
MGTQTGDSVRILGIDFGIYRRSKLRKSTSITIETHDVSQRRSNIFVNYMRAKRDMDVVSTASTRRPGRLTHIRCLPGSLPRKKSLTRPTTKNLGSS